jgi:hypothetical protein
MSSAAEQGHGDIKTGRGPVDSPPPGRRSAAPDRSHPSVDMTLVGKRIRRLHDHVCGRGQRVEITRAGCDDVCVMISKRELDALEAAVSIHSSTPAHADLCRALSRLLAEAGLVYMPQAYGESDAP